MIQLLQRIRRPREAPQPPPERIQAGPDTGLTAAQVRLRREQGQVNTPPKAITRTAGQILRDNLLTFFNFLNIGLFVALVAVDSYNNLFFMGVVLSNVLIGTIQEFRSKRTVERLSLLNAPRACVVRDGVQAQIVSEDLVLDDVVVLALGDQIPTDCVLLSGAIETDESHLSGESKPQFKQPGDTLLSGSAVLSGECRARVEHIGAGSYAHALAAEARKYKRPKSQLMTSLNTIIRFTGGIVLPLGVLLFSRSYFWLGHPIKSAVEQTAASMLGMIPAGLMLLTSVSLAVGVMTLGRRNMLAQQPQSIETLSRVSLLCLDKTGTLTTGNLFVEQALPAEGVSSAQFHTALGDLVRTMPAVNPTAHALRAYAQVQNGREARGITAFSSARRYSAASFDEGTLYVGAPELFCPELPEPLQYTVQEALVGGYRVLALAAGPFAQQPPPPQPGQLRLLGVLLLRDEVRAEAAETLRFFREQDVQIRLISGDNPATVSHIARRLDVPLAERYIDVSGFSDADLAEAANYYTVFGRVSPQQKKTLVRAFKRQGHTVAMTGDGVNDLLALRESDCSIALYNGSGAARQIAQLVLLTNDFSALPAAVMEGRRVINNITRTASLFLVKTIYSFLLTAASVLIGLAYPFQPVQLTLISALTVGLPSFFLSLEPNRARIKGDFLKNVLEQAIPGGVTVFLYTLVAGVLGPRLGLLQGQINTLCVYLAGTACLCVLLRVCLPLQNYRGVLFFTMVALFFGTSIVLNGMLRLELPPNGAMLWMYAIMSALCYPLLAGLAWILRRVIRLQR